MTDKKKKECLLGHGKFTVRLSTDGKWVETAKYSLKVRNISNEKKHPHLECLPFFEEKEAPSKPFYDSEEYCWLQIWELDLDARMKIDKRDQDWYLRDEEKNRRIAAFPGLVIQSGKGKRPQFSFRPIHDSAPVPGVSDLNGKIILRMTPTSKSEPEDFVIPLPEYEGILELAAVLRKTNSEHFLTGVMPSLHRIFNIEASLRRQIAERGGFAVAFVDPHDSLFWQAAEQMIGTLPTFKLDGSETRMGYYKISHWNKIASKLEDLRDAIKTLLGEKEPPKVAMVALYSHGFWDELLSFSLETTDVTDARGFVAQIENHLSDYAVIPLLACTCGRGRGEPTNSESWLKRYGMEYPCEELGADSLAWTLYRELKKKGKHPTIWAHTTFGHMAGNPCTRVFSEQGTADFINLVLEKDQVGVRTTKYYTSKFRRQGLSGKRLRRNNYNAYLLQTIKLQNASYLPWAWTGGVDLPKDNPRKQQVNRVLGEIRKNCLPSEKNRKTWNYELEFDDSRRYIVGLTPGVKKPSRVFLSKNFNYGEISKLADPLKLKVQLVKYIQLLRDRAGVVLTLRKIVDEGNGIVLKCAPKHQKRVLKLAKKMVKQDLLTEAEKLADGTIRLTLT